MVTGNEHAETDPAVLGPMSRRSLMKYGGALAAMAGMSAAGSPGASAQTLAGRPRTPMAPLALFDMRYLYSLDLSDPAQAASAYDQMQLVFTLQGLVNRETPQLYVNFSSSNAYYDGNPDEYWLAQLQQSGGFLAGRPTYQIPSLDELIQRFRPFLRGAVIWDPKVRSTSNVASTVAGAEDVVAIRYDTTAGSLYETYVADTASPLHLPPQVWLVNPDGSSLFTGSGTIPGTDEASSGSAKCDAYLWAKIKYLDTRRCDPSQLGYYLDAYWLADPTNGELQATCMANHDFLVSRRGFVFDLSPWADEEPPDDPAQPLGTDVKTLEAILMSAYQGTGGQMTAIHGFVPWQYKYTNISEPVASREGAVAAEWECVQIVSGYNAYLDADAPSIGTMANASVYTHLPLEASYPQPAGPTVAELQARGFVSADGSVVPKRYLMFYVGDFDSAAWMYNTLPGLWNDPSRGSVPLNWAFDPELSDRIAPAFLSTRATATDNDFFIAGDSGAGYLNPSALETPRASGLPSGLVAWQRHCSRHFRQWDISITGFVIDGNTPAMSQPGLQTYAQFSCNGFAEQDAAELGIVGTTSYLQMPDGFGGSTVAASAANIEAMFYGDASQAPYVPEWHSLRAALQAPTFYKEVAAQVQSDVPDAEAVFLDAFTFYALLRQYLKDQVIASASGPYVPVITGQSVPVTIGLTSYVSHAVSGTVSLSAPPGWTVSPAPVPFELAANATGGVTIGLEAPADAPLDESQEVYAVVTVNGSSRHYGFETITFSPGLGTADVSVTLGATNVDDGLLQLEEPGDGVTEAVTVDGESARETVQVVANDQNIYFQLASGVAFDGNFQATFTVNYYDSGTGTWVLEYDSNDTSATLDGAYTLAATVTNGNTNTWKTLTATVDNARFDHRENGGADFRVNSPTALIVRSVSLVVAGYGVNPA
jgi:hypothetical protein